MRIPYGISPLNGRLKVGSSKIDQVLKNLSYYSGMRVKPNLYPHKYDAIIARELFNPQVKAVQEGCRVMPHRWASLPFIYRGLIHCAECGYRITFERKR